MNYKFEKNKLYNYLGVIKEDLKRHEAYIAGGDWTIVYNMIDEIFDEVTLYKL